MMADVLVAVGKMDPRDECEARDTLARLEEMLVACEKHVRHEDEFVHRAMEARRPGSSHLLSGEHVEHLHAIEQLRAAAAARAPDLYRRVAIFMVENLAHMEHEESAGNSLLAELFSDGEMMAIEGRLVA